VSIIHSFLATVVVLLVVVIAKLLAHPTLHAVRIEAVLSAVAGTTPQLALHDLGVRNAQSRITGRGLLLSRA